MPRCKSMYRGNHEFCIVEKTTKEKPCILYVKMRQSEEYYEDLITENRPRFTETCTTKRSNNIPGRGRKTYESLKNNNVGVSRGIVPEVLKYVPQTL